MAGGEFVAPPNPELGGDHELVESGTGMVEVEEPNAPSLTPSITVDLERHPVGQVFVNLLVASHAETFKVLEIEDDPISLLLGHPLVEAQKSSPEPPLQQHLSLRALLSRQPVVGHVGPPEALQQPPSWLLSVAEFIKAVQHRRA